MASCSHTNNLSHEKSPYLLQHAHNPVHWYPWGQEAFNLAKSQNKMIFLSIGYSTCHWCHVMERESFENEEIGKLMNEHYVSIKVDREERPDVDRVYMTFVQALSGGGGWPLSIWLTPDLKPVFGGTYYPAQGFTNLLTEISQKWKDHEDKVNEQGSRILSALNSFSVMKIGGENLPEKKTVLYRGFEMLEESFDKAQGGFSKAPKFPQPVNLNFLIRYYQYMRNAKGKEALEMVKFTLDKMAHGGIYDHVSLGFHRYSTDGRWHVPHFEKMLYDQAQLAVAYAEAFQTTREPLYGRIAKEILEYVNRDLSHQDGGFFSAEDADSLPEEGSKEKKEGAFCVWTHDEVYKHLDEAIPGSEKKLSDLFARYYGIKKTGNVNPMQDPHGELKNKNVLIIEKRLEDCATYSGLEKTKVEESLAKARGILYEIRLKRPKPHLDDKILTSWNGMMISGFAKCGQVFENQSYVDRAIASATFIRENMYNEEKKILLRSAYTSKDRKITQIETPIEGFVDDYANLIRGLINLYEACNDAQWLEWAQELQETQNKLFWDNDDHGYFNTSNKDPSIVLRLKEDQDGAEPCANSVACSNLLRLADYLDCEVYREKALAIIRQFGERLQKIPIAVPEMVCGFLYHVFTPKQIIIVGEKDDENTQKLLQCVHRHFLPNKVLILADPEKQDFLFEKLSILKSLSKIDGKSTAYVCENYSCQLPVNEVGELEKLLLKCSFVG